MQDTAEGGSKLALILVSDLHGDLRDTQIGFSQKPGRLTDAVFLHVGRNGSAIDAFENRL